MLNYIKLSLLIIFCGLGILYFIFRDKLSTGIFEKESPVINSPQDFSGFGLDTAALQFSVSDQLSGLDAVIVRLEQAGRKKEVLNKTYSENTKSDVISLKINSKELGFKEGQLTLSISVFDKSFFSNATKFSANYDVDYHHPVVSSFMDQRNAVSGGTELVFFKVKEKNTMHAGVRYGNSDYLGISADKIDPIFSKYPDWYFSFFPVVKGISSGDKSLNIFAEDKVKNSETIAFNYHVQKMGYPKKNINLNAGVFEQKVESLFAELVKRQVIKSSTNDIIGKFNIINGKLREDIEKNLQSFLSKRLEKKYWDGEFQRFAGRDLSSFGQTVILNLNNQEISSLEESGITYQAAKGTSVYAASPGVVVFADFLGNFGNTVILDHGLGISTLYAHLANIIKKKGQVVEKGELIAASGDSGLVFSPSMHFEVRVYGVPVRPIEWWDDGWIKDHIYRKIDNLKADLGVVK